MERQTNPVKTQRVQKAFEHIHRQQDLLSWTHEYGPEKKKRGKKESATNPQRGTGPNTKSTRQENKIARRNTIVNENLVPEETKNRASRSKDSVVEKSCPS